MKNLNLDDFEHDILGSVENDLYELNRKSLYNGVLYKNSIQILVHQYISNKIHLDVS